MASNWRINVEGIDLGGTDNLPGHGWGYWQYAAELNPPLNILGVDWTHLLQRGGTTSPVIVWLGRLLANQTVLFSVGGWMPGVHFPGGFTVLPDGTGVIP